MVVVFLSSGLNAVAFLKQMHGIGVRSRKFGLENGPNADKKGKTGGIRFVGLIDL
jgi:hypothetical protein